MRITTGLYKGRRLTTVPDLTVRPATERVRQTLFNMLVNRIPLDGATVLDLFAGSGSLGFEALSRGARHVVFVELDPAALRHLEENAARLGCTGDVEILATDALQFVRATDETFSLVFADPPYAYPHTASLPAEIFARRVVAPGGFLLIEHATSVHFDASTSYAVGPEKKFGRTHVTFFQPPKA